MTHPDSKINVTAPASKPLIKVLLVAPSMSIIGGQAVQADFLFKRLRLEPSLSVSFEPINPALAPFLRPIQGIRFIRTIPTFALYVFRLFHAMRRCDVVHVFSASYFSFLLAPTPAILFGWLLRKPVILNYHSGEAEDHLARWPLAVRTAALATQIVVPSGYLAEVFARFGLHASVVPNAVDLRAFRFRARANPRPAFLANRNFEAHYNVACVLRAFARIQASRPDASLTVIGDGPQREALKALSSQLGLQHVRFLGRIAPDSMPAQYEEHDVWLNASDIDNMPISILEAYSSGVAVVSTSAGGIPYIVDDGKTGRLVPQGDHEALADAALQVLEAPGQFERLTQGGKKECVKYSWAAIREGWLATYSRCTRCVPERKDV